MNAAEHIKAISTGATLPWEPNGTEVWRDSRSRTRRCVADFLVTLREADLNDQMKRLEYVFVVYSENK